MRILHLFSSPAWSGTADTVATLALAQRAAGHEVSVAVGVGDPAGAEAGAARWAAMGLLDPGGLTLRVGDRAGPVFADIRRLRKRRLEVVHAHFGHDHWVAWWGTPARAACIRSLHGGPSRRGFVAPADGLTAGFGLALRHLGHPNVAVLPALTGSQFGPGERRRFDGGPVVGVVGSFRPSRRHALALEAFAQLRETRPDARLVLAGAGPGESSIRAEIAARGLQAAVDVVPRPEGPALAALLRGLDVAWVTGLGSEGAGRSAAEARACGTRVVAVDEGGLPEWADSVVEPVAAEFVRATLEGTRRELFPRTPAEVAGELDRLYARARS